MPCLKECYDTSYCSDPEKCKEIILTALQSECSTLNCSINEENLCITCKYIDQFTTCISNVYMYLNTESPDAECSFCYRDIPSICGMEYRKN